MSDRRYSPLGQSGQRQVGALRLPTFLSTIHCMNRDIIRLGIMIEQIPKARVMYRRPPQQTVGIGRTKNGFIFVIS